MRLDRKTPIPSYSHTQPVALLQQLVRFDTTNSPGNESEYISFIKNLLNEAGIQTTILVKMPERPNLVARLPEQGNASPYTFTDK